MKKIFNVILIASVLTVSADFTLAEGVLSKDKTAKESVPIENTSQDNIDLAFKGKKADNQLKKSKKAKEKAKVQIVEPENVKINQKKEIKKLFNF